MSQLKALKAATTLGGVAHLLEIKVGMLSFLLYKKPKATLYTKFDIPKSYGGTREIWAPDKDLKLIQHRLAQLLQNCLAEISAGNGHAEDDEQHGIAHGFKRKHTIMTNARVHVTRRYVFNVDLHDFFGSINFGRVRGFFLKDKNFALQPKAATVLAQIACHENKLPQGSPCSPVISNLIGHTLDVPLARLAAGAGCTYTRYADDLTFSSNKRSFSSRIATQDDAAKDKWTPGQGLKRLVKRGGFSFNDGKTRMQYRDSRQEVTGLVVNRKVNVPASYRYTVRAMVDKLFKTGQFEFIVKKFDAQGAPVLTGSPGQSKQLMGMLSYIDQVDLFNRKLCEKNGAEPTPTPGRIELFRRFLYFDAFYAPTMPVIVCEGKTDNTYLKHAIKSLASSYPMLATAGSPPKLGVRFFKYSGQRTSHITEITGGVGGLCKLMKHYQSDIDTKFKAPVPRHPVIVLIDNDSGANSIYGAIAGITGKKKPTGTEQFIHVVGNLYVVPTPLGSGDSETMIEDFFDAETLKALLNGKTFSKKSDGDNEKEYGKAAFARDVVEKNAGTINFKGFKGILDRVAAVIAEYAKTHPNAEVTT
jgi:RNA-directed DNA polymerase